MWALFGWRGLKSLFANEKTISSGRSAKLSFGVLLNADERFHNGLASMGTPKTYNQSSLSPLMLVFIMLVSYSSNAFGGGAPSAAVTVVGGVPVVSFTDLPGGIRLFHTPRFTKLDSAGKDLPKSVISWTCVRDNANGRVWEVKAPAGAGGLRDAKNTYSWYNSTGVNDGGNPGTANGGVCADRLNCDTEKYVDAVNAVGLCGGVGWRLPNQEELRSIVDYSIAAPSPTIDTGYFPNTITPGGVYWSASSYAIPSSLAWVIYFGDGGGNLYIKRVGHYVRLVRGGQ